MHTTCLLLLLDGLGDKAYPDLGHRTPLAAAHTPNMDRLAASGGNGLFHASSIGLALPSELAHFSLFGFDPAHFPGRGALEALGAGIPLAPDDVAVLAHFTCLTRDGDTLVLRKDVPSLSRQHFERMVHGVGEFSSHGLTIRFVPTEPPFGVLLLQGGASVHITDSNPIAPGSPLCAVRPHASHAQDKAAIATALALSAYLRHVYHTLAGMDDADRPMDGDLPVNGMIHQRPGRLKPRPSFAELSGLSGATLSEGPLYKGMAAYLGLDFHPIGVGLSPGEAYGERIRAALELANDRTFIHIHSKWPDKAAHTKDHLYKMRVIEELDQALTPHMDRLANDPDLLVVLTADHSTPSSGPMVHSGEPVPVAFRGRGVRRDGVNRFDEVSAASGSLGQLRGPELFYMILNCLEKSKLVGIMDTERDQLYWPGSYTPFSMNED